MNARPWRLLAPLALIVAFPISAQDGGMKRGPEGITFEAPADLEDDVLSASRPGPHDPGLLLLLSLFDRAPTSDELEPHEPGLFEKLEAVVTDDDVLRLARVRAISALATIGDDRSFDLVVSISRDVEVHPRLRIQALWAIGHRFQDRQGREAILAEALAEPDHGLRLHAVRSLAAVGSEEAMGIIDLHRMAERHVAVRELLRELKEAEVGDATRLAPEGLSPSRLNRPVAPPLAVPEAPRGVEEVER